MRGLHATLLDARGEATGPAAAAVGRSGATLHERVLLIEPAAAPGDTGAAPAGGGGGGGGFGGGGGGGGGRDAHGPRGGGGCGVSMTSQSAQRLEKQRRKDAAKVAKEKRRAALGLQFCVFGDPGPSYDDVHHWSQLSSEREY